MVFTGAVTAVAEDAAATATITGHVTREGDGSPVAFASIFVNSTDFTKNGVGFTDENGDYAVSGLKPGEYTVRFATETIGGGLLSEYWDGAQDRSSAQRITLTDGETINGIDATLQQGGSISGRVTQESDGAPQSGVTVYFSPNSLSLAPATARTAEDGTYRVDALVPGEYMVRFDAPTGSLADEFWDGAHDQQSATRVQVIAGEETPGIDASLVGGATISGQVTTAADGSAVSGSVSASSDGGGYVSAPINPDGSYSLSVGPGTYSVQFSSYDSRVLSEYWENARTQAEATAITVVPGQSLTLSAQLDAASAITGVVLIDGAPLADAIVEAWRDGQNVGMAYANMDGEYELMLPAGTYTVSAWGSSYDATYAKQYYDSADTASEATAVTLGSDADRTGVDFDLAVGGSIQGTVAAGNAELEGMGAEVTAYLWSAREWRAVARAYTVGEYVLGGTGWPLSADGGLLPAGTYTIGVEAEGFCTQFYGGAGSLEDADSFELAPGETLESIDVTLLTECVEPEPKPTLELSSTSVKAGGDITVTGENFAPGEKVAFELHSEPISLGELVAGEDGTLSGTFRIPSTVPAGAHHVVALGAESAFEVSVAIEVTAVAGGGGTGTVGGGGGSGLANTGASVPVTAALAGLFLAVLGAFLLRRRRSMS
ncbi:carboxypeptidase regulatory-like domain-containing protein [Microbacterium sp. LWO13-1.2]|uniref:carboxypeptidase regulatory-like domain-containing protein n=1 Tax=Microbacterium sp. LWO13-1.2 TaxID=3135262 RepID=UPI0031390733